MTRLFPRSSILTVLLITVLRVPTTENRRSEGLREARRRQHREHTKSQILVVICKLVRDTFDNVCRVPPGENRRSERHAGSASEAAPEGRSPLENVGRRRGAVTSQAAAKPSQTRTPPPMTTRTTHHPNPLPMTTRIPPPIDHPNRQTDKSGRARPPTQPAKRSSKKGSTNRILDAAPAADLRFEPGVWVWSLGLGSAASAEGL